MKIKLLNIISIVMILVLATACGGDGSSTKIDEVKISSVNIRVEKPSEQNFYFSKTSNVDLKIASMQIHVYKTDDVADKDISDNTLLSTQALTKDASQWKGTLTALEKESIYIYDVIGKNTADQKIFGGRTTKKIETGVSNNVDIKLTQSTDLFDESDSIPTATNIVVSKDSNENILFFFNIMNPNEDNVTWKIFELDGTTLSSEFSVNTGTTSNLSEAVSVVYNKDTNSNNIDYVLELTSTEGEIRYTFSIDFEGETVSVTVNTPPVIESLTIVVEGDSLTITPVLDKESSAVTYAWSFEYSYDEVITNPTDKTVVITGYNEDSYLDLKLEVLENGTSSYRIYKIRGYSHSNVQLIDTSKQEVLDILGISKVEADALLALYQNTSMASNNFFETWNTLTPVSEWEGVTVDNGSVIELNVVLKALKGIIPSELGDLSNLKKLNLSWNYLTGAIPTELGNLSNLTNLILYRNQLTGSIPAELGNLSNLTNLILFSNQLTGTLPLSFSQLGALEIMDISYNPLKGVISDQSFMTFLNALDSFKFTNTELSIQGVTSD